MNIVATVEIVKELSKLDGRKAGNELENFASLYGDDKMLSVIKELDMVELSLIIRAHDATIPSIAIALMDVDTLSHIIETEPSNWREELFDDEKMVESCKALLLQIFESDNIEQQKELLQVFKNTDFALFYLSLPFFSIDFENYDCSEEQVSGSSEYLYQVITTLDQEIAESIHLVLATSQFSNLKKVLKVNADDNELGLSQNFESESMFSL